MGEIKPYSYCGTRCDDRESCLRARIAALESALRKLNRAANESARGSRTRISVCRMVQDEARVLLPPEEPR